MIRLRPLDPAGDAAAALALINSYNLEPATLEEFAGWMNRNPPGRDVRRMVAVDEGDCVVGYALADHQAWSPEGNYYIWVVVDSSRRGQGTGATLLRDAYEYALGKGATTFKSEVREFDDGSLAFARRRGFEIDRHQFESVLDLPAFDGTPFREVEAAVSAGGIRILSLAELGNTRENRRKLHAVNYATALDIPGSDGKWMPFEEFDEMVTHAAWFCPEGQFGALIGDEWIGLSAVQLLPETQGSYNLMTGVLPAYRGRGIALALKLAAIRYARASGAVTMRTHNDSLNQPVLALNRKLGYRPLPGIYFLRMEIDK